MPTAVDHKHAVLYTAVAMFLQKSWEVHYAYQHGPIVGDVSEFEAASWRRGADCIDGAA
jgi:hypothetical protein